MEQKRKGERNTEKRTERSTGRQTEIGEGARRKADAPNNMCAFTRTHHEAYRGSSVVGIEAKGLKGEESRMCVSCERKRKKS